MIDKNGGKFLLICDNCGEEAEEQFEAFLEKLKDRGYWREG